MKPDCQNFKCSSHDVEYEGACDMHRHSYCDSYVAKRPPERDRLESCRAATRYVFAFDNAVSNANKLEAIKQALAECLALIVGDAEGTDAETREVVANRKLRRFLEENL